MYVLSSLLTSTADLDVTSGQAAKQASKQEAATPHVVLFHMNTRIFLREQAAALLWRVKIEYM